MKAIALVALLGFGCSGGGDARHVAEPPSPQPMVVPDARPSARWIALLEDPDRRDDAVTELEALCDAESIPALGEAWKRDDRSLRILQAIINVASCSSWELALPFLHEAVAELDDTMTRSIDVAVAAAAALGHSKLPAAVAPLVELATHVMKMKSPGLRARMTAVAALGELGDLSAIPVLAKIVRTDPLTQPPQLAGAAIIALGQLRAPEVVPVLLEAMYTTPFFMQTQRALVEVGADAVVPELRRILRGEHAEIDGLIRELGLDRACDEDGACHAVAPRDYYAAIVLGAFHDPAGVPELVGALGRSKVPAYRMYGANGPPAANPILDALHKIGSPDAAPDVLALALDKKVDAGVRAMAMSTYGFVSVDGAEPAGKRTGVAAMCALAGDDKADATLRLAAAESCGHLADELAEAAPLQKRAAKHRAVAIKAKGDDAPAQWSYARAFDAMIARVEIAARCKDDVACLMGALDATGADLTVRLIDGGWIVEDSDRDAAELVWGQIERAVLELARLGAADQLGPMIDKVAAGYLQDRLVRTVVLLAVARIAPRPCATCVTAIDALIAAGAGDTAIAQLDAEAKLVAALLRP